MDFFCCKVYIYALKTGSLRASVIKAYFSFSALAAYSSFSFSVVKILFIREAPFLVEAFFCAVYGRLRGIVVLLVDIFWLYFIQVLQKTELLPQLRLEDSSNCFSISEYAKSLFGSNTFQVLYSFILVGSVVFSAENIKFLKQTNVN